MTIAIIIGVILLLLSNTPVVRFILLLGVGLLFNPITMLLIFIVYESSKRGIK